MINQHTSLSLFRKLLLLGGLVVLASYYYLILKPQHYRAMYSIKTSNSSYQSDSYSIVDNDHIEFTDVDGKQVKIPITDIRVISTIYLNNNNNQGGEPNDSRNKANDTSNPNKSD